MLCTCYCIGEGEYVEMDGGPARFRICNARSFLYYAVWISWTVGLVLGCHRRCHLDHRIEIELSEVGLDMELYGRYVCLHSPGI